MKLSVAIVAFNEEKRIAECINSARFANEIVVVDGYSTDKTAEIAKKMGAKVVFKKNELLMKINMNFAFSKCKSEWIFSLDADETITPELKEEIQSIDGRCTAYRVPRKNIIFKKWIEHSRWYPDYQLRLFKKGKASFPEQHVHEELEVDGDIGTLVNPITHHNWETVSDFLLRFDSYTTREAQKLIEDGKVIKWSDALFMPLNEFLSRFFAGEGYKDGLHGLVLAFLMAFYMEVTFAKIWEKQGFWEYNSDNFLAETRKESARALWDIRHWFIEAEKNSFFKNILKIKRRICSSLS